MPDYRLSEAAKQDLVEIAQYGDQYFGLAQSDNYRAQLTARFSLIAIQPELYPAVDHIRQGYRRSVCGAHAIYYQVNRDTNTVDIIRIIGRQDTANAF